MGVHHILTGFWPGRNVLRKQCPFAYFLFRRWTRPIVLYSATKRSPFALKATPWGGGGHDAGAPLDPWGPVGADLILAIILTELLDDLAFLSIEGKLKDFLTAEAWAIDAFTILLFADEKAVEIDGCAL